MSYGPDLTSTSGAFASSEYSSPFSAEKAFDDDTESLWASNADDTQWLGCYIPGGAAIAKITITTRASGAADKTPTSFEIRGANAEPTDGSTDGTLLHTVTDDTGWSAGETRSYEFVNSTSYSHYWVYMTDKDGNFGKGSEYDVPEVSMHEVVVVVYPLGDAAGTSSGAVGVTRGYPFGDASGAGGATAGWESGYIIIMGDAAGASSGSVDATRCYPLGDAPGEGASDASVTRGYPVSGAGASAGVLDWLSALFMEMGDAGGAASGSFAPRELLFGDARAIPYPSALDGGRRLSVWIEPLSSAAGAVYLMPMAGALDSAVYPLAEAVLGAASAVVYGVDSRSVLEGPRRVTLVPFSEQSADFEAVIFPMLGPVFGGVACHAYGIAGREPLSPEAPSIYQFSFSEQSADFEAVIYPMTGPVFGPTAPAVYPMTGAGEFGPVRISAWDEPGVDVLSDLDVVIYSVGSPVADLPAPPGYDWEIRIDGRPVLKYIEAWEIRLDENKTQTEFEATIPRGQGLWGGAIDLFRELHGTLDSMAGTVRVEVSLGELIYRFLIEETEAEDETTARIWGRGPAGVLSEEHSELVAVAPTEPTDAETTVADLLDGSGLTLDWQLPAFQLDKEFNAAGYPVDVISEIAGIAGGVARCDGRGSLYVGPRSPVRPVAVGRTLPALEIDRTANMFSFGLTRTDGTGHNSVPVQGKTVPVEMPQIEVEPVDGDRLVGDDVTVRIFWGGAHRVMSHYATHGVVSGAPGVETLTESELVTFQKGEASLKYPPKRILSEDWIGRGGTITADPPSTRLVCDARRGFGLCRIEYETEFARVRLHDHEVEMLGALFTIDEAPEVYANVQFAGLLPGDISEADAISDPRINSLTLAVARGRNHLDDTSYSHDDATVEIPFDPAAVPGAVAAVDNPEMSYSGNAEVISARIYQDGAALLAEITVRIWRV